jgi:3-hydroxyacyl-CoA dehydrogenase
MTKARIAIVGGGFVGRSWAMLFAAHGHAVTVQDPYPAALAELPDLARRALDEMAALDLLDDPVDAILARIRTEPDLATAVADADYVQENAPERLDVKQALFAELDRLCPPYAILASSSSSLTCSQIAAALPGRARCIIAHPANPPHLLRAVEMVPAPFTDPAVTERATEILQGIGQVPVRIGEIDGFVMNRLQAALGREALALVENGIADAEAVDAIVRHSLGLRWAFMGPFETMDLNAPGGFRDYARRFGPSFAGFWGEPGWPAQAVDKVDGLRRKMLPADRLDERRDWRDRRQTALVAHLRGAETDED